MVERLDKMVNCFVPVAKILWSDYSTCLLEICLEDSRGILRKYNLFIHFDQASQVNVQLFSDRFIERSLLVIIHTLLVSLMISRPSFGTLLASNNSSSIKSIT